MRKYDPRLIIGGMLVLGGLLSLLDVMGFISNAGGIFWGLIWGVVGIFFIYLLLNDRSRNWWAAFPGFTFIGMAVSSILPEPLNAFGGLIFFAGISLAFWWAYFTDTSRWWAIIPGGILLTLGIVSVFDEISSMDTGGIFFIGMGLTFALLALLPGRNKQSWAMIPAVILLIFGTLLGIPSFNLGGYVVPLILLVLGGFLVFSFFKPTV